MQLIKCMERPLAKMYQINLVERKEPFKFGRPNLEFWLVPSYTKLPDPDPDSEIPSLIGAFA